MENTAKAIVGNKIIDIDLGTRAFESIQNIPKLYTKSKWANRHAKVKVWI